MISYIFRDNNFGSYRTNTTWWRHLVFSTRTSLIYILSSNVIFVIRNLHRNIIVLLSDHSVKMEIYRPVVSQLILHETQLQSLHHSTIFIVSIISLVSSDPVQMYAYLITISYWDNHAAKARMRTISVK